MELDFKELSNDEDMCSRLSKFAESVDQIQEVLKFAQNPEFYDQLTNAEKIKFNLLMSFTLNGLFWMYLRAEGIDPTKHQIKVENDRLKQSMARAKQIHDRNTIMPRLNKGVAERFIRNGLWTLKPRADDTYESTPNETNNINQTEENWDA
ncbi:nuclear nucleic acid-binding protein C1D-like [Phymastichus coffea]|uniref:nuclear nucleic acid-binding protein C1D-like n=1 Tax=Phymastichus coffea TaxID=108790 RepID=UPI00273ABB70|nr:nuclear nucleic acid-binding protein C1D-like [Phymastichus coffea]